MARADIYRSEVLRARDNLVAQGRYPSIDAIRIELGNTSSKVTIHRYLKQIDEEEGPVNSKELVTCLAARLQDEADTRLWSTGWRSASKKHNHCERCYNVWSSNPTTSSNPWKHLQYLQGEIKTLNQALTSKQEEPTLSHRVN